MSIRSNDKNLSILTLVLIRNDVIARERVTFVMIYIDDAELDDNAFILIDALTMINDASIIVNNAFIIIDNVSIIVDNAFTTINNTLVIIDNASLAIATTSLRNIKKDFFYIRFF